MASAFTANSSAVLIAGERVAGGRGWRRTGARPLVAALCRAAGGGEPRRLVVHARRMAPDRAVHPERPGCAPAKSRSRLTVASVASASVEFAPGMPHKAMAEVPMFEAPMEPVMVKEAASVKKAE
jgi:hypothetical protein